MGQVCDHLCSSQLHELAGLPHYRRISSVYGFGLLWCYFLKPKILPLSRLNHFRARETKYGGNQAEDNAVKAQSKLATCKCIIIMCIGWILPISIVQAL